MGSQFKHGGVRSLVVSSFFLLACSSSSNVPTAEAPPPPPTGECVTNADCLQKAGDFNICKHSTHTCVKLLSEDCYKVSGDYKSDNALVFGQLDRGDPDVFSSVVMAADEVNAAVGGVPAPDGAPRPIVVVQCTATDDLLRAAKYLIDTIGVPAIVGPGNSGDTIEIANKASVAAGVLLMAPVSTSPLLSTLQANDLVFRPIPSDAAQSAIMAKLVPDIETAIRAKNGNTPIKVAVISKKDAYGTYLAQALAQSLVINGQNALDPSNSSNYATWEYVDPEGDYDNWDVSAVVSAVVAFKPDIVFPIGTFEVLKFAREIENNWPAAATRRPEYIYPDGAVDEDQSWLTKVAAPEETRKRIRGMRPGNLSLPNFLTFSSRFTKLFPNIDPTLGAANAYDGTYALLHAAAAAGANVTGVELGKGLRRITAAGVAVNVGPDDAKKGFDALRGGGAIDLSGATGSLVFEAAGDTVSDYTMYCAVPDGQGSYTMRASGQIWNAAKQAFEGQITGCN